MYQVCDEDQEMGQGIVIFFPPDLKDSFWVGEMSEELAAWLGMSRGLPRRGEVALVTLDPLFYKGRDGMPTANLELIKEITFSP